MNVICSDLLPHPELVLPKVEGVVLGGWQDACVVAKLLLTT